MSETLKFPDGEFTHSELATFNGKTNQQVYIQFRTAIQKGVIVQCGQRKGQGKPSNLYKKMKEGYIGNPQVETVADIQSISRVNREPVTVEVLIVKPNDTEIAEIVAAKVAVMNLTDVPVIVSQPIPAENPVSPVAKVDLSTAIRIEDVCPFCKNQLWSIVDATGVMVWCDKPSEVCNSNETPYGHGRNSKDAYLTLIEKFEHLAKA